MFHHQPTLKQYGNSIASTTSGNIIRPSIQQQGIGNVIAANKQTHSTQIICFHGNGQV
jgi:hypothetical protein